MEDDLKKNEMEDDLQLKERKKMEDEKKKKIEDDLSAC
jgi:hypothetical protein